MSKINILIVEDDISTQKLYDKGLSDNEFHKRFSESGADALEIYKSWNPDIVILDLVLPDLDGHSVLKEIRDVMKDNDTKVIISTSSKDNEKMMDCLKLGVQSYLVKPFNYHEISAKVMSAADAGMIQYEKYGKLFNIKPDSVE